MTALALFEHRPQTDVSEVDDAGAAVVADDYWSALLGREVLAVEFDPGAHAALSSEAIHDQLRQATFEKGKLIS